MDIRMQQRRPEQTKQVRNTNSKVNLNSWKTLIYVLDKHNGLTQKQIRKLTGLGNTTISQWLRELHKKPNCVYIAGWVRESDLGDYARQWKFGFYMADVPRPRPLGNTEYSRRYRRNLAIKKEKEDERRNALHG
jgi:transcriptional regulator with XRE-family HTH domain